MGSKSDKISIRITPNQSLVLAEMSHALNVSYSMLIRTIIGDWLKHNEEYIYRIIDKNRIDNATDKQAGKKEEDL